MSGLEEATVTVAHRSVGLFKRGDLIELDGRVARIVEVRSTVLTLVWRDGWFWRVVRFLCADYDRTVDRWLCLLAWFRRPV